MNYNFDLDLPLGEEGERILSDIFLGGKKVEVKRDYKTYYTGNIVVEFECRGRPSGISTTESDWWITLLSGGYNDSVLIGIKTDRLKDIIKNSNYRISNGGDENQSLMYIIPVTDLLK